MMRMILLLIVMLLIDHDCHILHRVTPPGVVDCCSLEEMTLGFRDGGANVVVLARFIRGGVFVQCGVLSYSWRR